MTRQLSGLAAQSGTTTNWLGKAKVCQLGGQACFD